jgi:glycosyltransferase involved in cell wall biosynthesis
VIYEALAAGTPVLIADTTPWRNLAELGVGWDLPLDDPRAFGNKITEVARLSAPEQIELRNRARMIAEARRMDGDVIEATRQMLDRAVASSVPSC